MKYKILGSSGIKISAVALGTWAIGGTFWGGTNEADAENSIRSSIENGINFIDTAPAYGFGLAEEVIGKVIKNKRDSVIIATKCGLVWDNNDSVFHYSFPIAGKEETVDVYRNLKKDSIKKEIVESLLRLGTDYIDLYITHWPDPPTPAEETMGALNELKEQGLIRAIGISNVNAEIASSFAEYGIVDAVQEQYSIIDRKVESELLPWCKDNNAVMMAYSPLAMGLLTGKLDPLRKFTSDDARVLFGGNRFKPDNIRATNEQIDKYLSPLAKKHNCSPGNIIIAYFIEQNKVVAVMGARNETQAIENVKALNIMLDDEDRIAIKSFIEKYEHHMQ